MIRRNEFGNKFIQVFCVVLLTLLLMYLGRNCIANSTVYQTIYNGVKSKVVASKPDTSPLASYRKISPAVLPSAKELEKLSDASRFALYYSYFENPNYMCKQKIRIGIVYNGGYDVCDDIEYRPVKPCLVYSFGINNEFSFDDGMANAYECDVYSFDPSMSQKSHRRSPRVYFSKQGIAGTTGTGPKGWDLRTLGDFKKLLNHTNMIIDVLKIDTEGAEYNSLPQMIASGTLSKVRQLLLEVHDFQPHILETLKIFTEIERLGFRKFYANSFSGPAPICHVIQKALPLHLTKCHEVGFINTNLKKLIS